MTSENETKVVENSTEEIVNNEVEEVTAVEEVAAVENNVEEVAMEENPAETVEKPVKEEAPVEEKTTQEEFISEFAPAPIKIPNYNKEKEMRKRVKMKEKDKKFRSKKSRKRRKLIKKIFVIARSVFLFIMLFAMATATVSALYVKMNTSEYAVKKAIRDAEPETFVIGEIKKPREMNLQQESSKIASMADVLRDNTFNKTVAYADIEGAVMRSSYPEFVADIAYEIMHYYLYDADYSDITKDEIKEAILENASYIELVTGRPIGETASEEIAAYIVKSPEIKSLNLANIAKQKASDYTHITSLMFSTVALIGFVVSLLLFMVLTVMFCKGYSYKLIGGATILSGIVCAAVGYIYKPAFIPSGEFIKSVFDAITKMLNHNALVFGGVTVLVGALIMLVGSTINEDDDEDEDEYIDEIEQVSTAQ